MQNRLQSFGTGSALVVSLCFLVPSAAPAQDGGAPAAHDEAGTHAAQVEEQALKQLGTDSPRGAVYQFIIACRAGDYESAAQHLNLSGLPPAVRKLGGPELARQLHAVLDQTLWLEWATISDAPTGLGEDGLDRSHDRLGTIETSTGPVDVLVEQASWHQGTPVWKVANESVAKIPALYKEFGYGPLSKILPKVFFELRFLDVQAWQWIGLLLLAIVAVLAGRLLTFVVARLAGPIFRRSRTQLDDHFLDLAISPVRLMLAAAFFSAGMYALGLAIPVRWFLASLATAIMAVAGIWLLSRLVDVAAEVVQGELATRGRALAMSVVPLGRRTAKFLLVTIGTLVVLQNFGLNVTGLVAGLGIGGLAFALAAQKTIENLFGGVTLIADRPVIVGDFCRYGDQVGTVEEVGLRSTRIRTLERTVVTIPNSDFSSMQLENFGQRDRIRFYTTLGLRYETTPDQLRYLLVELRKLLVGHPRVAADPARARFVGLGAFSLDVEITAYVVTTDWNEFLAIREDLLLRIMEAVDASGTGFAFPSQTVYVGKDDGPDEPRTSEAERTVQAWRDQSDLGLPHFRPEQVTEMTNTLEYPPSGSATGEASDREGGSGEKLR